MLRHGLLRYWWLLYQHSKCIGQRTDVFRNVEDSFALKHASACMSRGKTYVDIGSGPSALPTLVCQQWGATTVATDLEDTWLERQDEYRTKLGLSSDTFRTQQENATDLSFADSSIDLLTAISTVEHIPDEGDTEAMEEFCRVLRSGGRLVVTVPTSETYTEQESTFYYAGFERRYDRAALQTRLCVGGLLLVDQLYMVPPPHEIVGTIKEEFPAVLQAGNPLDLWYRQGYHESHSDISILLTLGLIELSGVSGTNSFGACLAFMKT